jgi:hypothetical protein
MFALGDPGRIRELVTGARFGEPELEEIALEVRYADFDDVWDALVRLSGQFSRAISALNEDEQHATREAIMQSLAPFRNEDGSYTAPGVTWGVLAR